MKRSMDFRGKSFENRRRAHIHNDWEALQSEDEFDADAYVAELLEEARKEVKQQQKVSEYTNVKTEYYEEEDAEYYEEEDAEYYEEEDAEYYEEEDAEYYEEEDAEYYEEEDAEYYEEEDAEYYEEEDAEYYEEEDAEYYEEEDAEYYEEEDAEYYEEEDAEYYEEEDAEYYEEENAEHYEEEDTYHYEETDKRKQKVTFVEYVSSSKNKLMDYMVIFGAIAMVVVALLLGGTYLLKNNGSEKEEALQVGSQLANIEVIGQQGLLAMSDAQKALLNVTQLPQETVPPQETMEPDEEEEPKYEEEEYKIDVNVKLSFTSIERDLKIKFLNRDTGKLVGNVPFAIEITNADGDTVFWSDDDMDGIIYKKNLTAGKCTVKVQELAGEKYKSYGIPTEEMKVDIKSDIVYEKVDVTAEIKTESQVDVNKEDTKNNHNITEEYKQDTVLWVESTIVEDSYEEIQKGSIPDPSSVVITERFDRFQTGITNDTNPASDLTTAPLAPPIAPVLPEVTATPAPSEVPGATATPNPSEVPGVIAPPVSTEVPGATATPVPSEAPGATATPTSGPTMVPGTVVVELERKTAVLYTNEKLEMGIVVKNQDAGDITFTAESSDVNVVKAEIVGNKLAITGVAAGKNVSVTVIAKVKDAVVKAVPCIVEVQQNPKDDKNSVLKDNLGREVYVLENNTYRQAYHADYYTATSFFVKKEKQYTGWQTIDGKVKYFDVTGKYVTGEQIIQGVKYNFASDGALVTGSGTKGIDVSKWNGTINWSAVKNAGISYVIIRCGYRGSSQGALIEDSKFRENIKGATAAGLKVGIYFFSQAIDKSEALEEASMVLELMKGYTISYPVFLDVEPSGGRADSLDVATRTEICKTFCETIKQYGYTPGIYANKTWLESKLDMSILNNYKVWLAQYASEPTYQGRYDMWQYKDTGVVSGVSGMVDLNMSYLGY